MDILHIVQTKQQTIHSTIFLMYIEHISNIYRNVVIYYLQNTSINNIAITQIIIDQVSAVYQF